MVYVRATKTALLKRIPRGPGVVPMAGYTEKGCVFDWPEECGPPDADCTEPVSATELLQLGLSDGRPKNKIQKKKRPAIQGPRINESGELET